jgi:hypothetical protein
MKYLVMTAPDTSGISEVFYSLLLSEGVASSSLIERWNLIEESSPVKVVSTNKAENLGINAVWDEQSKTFSESSSKPLQQRKPTDTDAYSFVINDEVVSIIVDNEPEVNGPKFDAGFSEPVIVKSVPEDSEIDLGYLWNGNEFLAPEGL